MIVRSMKASGHLLYDSMMMISIYFPSIGRSLDEFFLNRLACRTSFGGFRAWVRQARQA